MAARWRRWRWRLAAILAAYVVFIMLDGFVSWFLLFPSTNPEDALGARRESIAHDARRMEVLVARSRPARDREPAAYVLHFGGNASRAEWCAAAVAHDWAEFPVEVWALNYPGFGASEGQAKLSAFPAAAIAAFDALSRQAAGRPIYIQAESLGTTLALHVAAQRPVAGLVLQNPPPLQNLILGRHGWWNLWLLAWPVARGVPAEMNSLKSAPRAKCPAIFLLSQDDQIVPPEYQQKVVDAYSAPKRTVAVRGGHNDGIAADAREQYQTHLRWLWQSNERGQ